MVIATLMESEGFESDERMPPFKEIYPQVKEYVRNLCSERGLAFDGNAEITYKNTKITFYLNLSYKARRYFLCFQPKDIWDFPYKAVLIPPFRETVEFFESLPSRIELTDMVFTKSSVTGSIDISAWKFSTNPDLGESSIQKLKGFSDIRRIGAGIYDKNRALLKKHLLIIDAAGILNGLKLNTLKGKMGPLFEKESEVIKNTDNTLEILDGRGDRDNLFVLFLARKKRLISIMQGIRNILSPMEYPLSFSMWTDLITS
jgi:hypothetical protein